MKAVNVLDTSATPATFKYEFTLYVPIFTQAALELSLTESGAPFKVRGPLACSAFSLDIEVASEQSEIKITADLCKVLVSFQFLRYQPTS